MANKMVANIKSLTTETRGLTKEVESLYKSIEKLNAIAGKAFKKAASLRDSTTVKQLDLIHF
jgi:hypothetical protein